MAAALGSAEAKADVTHARRALLLRERECGRSNIAVLRAIRIREWKEMPMQILTALSWALSRAASFLKTLKADGAVVRKFRKLVYSWVKLVMRPAICTSMTH